MTDFVTTVRRDTNEIYGRLDDAQDDRLDSHVRLGTSMDASDKELLRLERLWNNGYSTADERLEIYWLQTVDDWHSLQRHLLC
ncbi:hypothetical protein Tco_1133998 [Tanacetum coccineum]